MIVHKSDIYFLAKGYFMNMMHYDEKFGVRFMIVDILDIKLGNMTIFLLWPANYPFIITVKLMLWFRHGVWMGEWLICNSRVECKVYTEHCMDSVWHTTISTITCYRYLNLIFEFSANILADNGNGKWTLFFCHKWQTVEWSCSLCQTEMMH